MAMLHNTRDTRKSFFPQYVTSYAQNCVKKSNDAEVPASTMIRTILHCFLFLYKS